LGVFGQRLSEVFSCAALDMVPLIAYIWESGEGIALHHEVSRPLSGIKRSRYPHTVEWPGSSMPEFQGNRRAAIRRVYICWNG
jgi:hypothetical protein